LAKIAVKCEAPARRLIASGNGWSVADVVCTSGPRDRPFEEQHRESCVAIVLGGTFQYRTSTGRELMVPGSFLLGNTGDGFTCGHEHGIGDRCVSFWFTEEFRERVREGAAIDAPCFRTPRVAPMRELTPMVSRAAELLRGGEPGAYEELGIQTLVQAMQVSSGFDPHVSGADASSLARVTRVIRLIDSDPDAPHDLNRLAQIARLSPYHFLRVFEGLTGTTPHQYLLRVRLRRAAARLRKEETKVADIALGCGFGDISNFNRTFRAEFGVTPRVYRRS
jgi:AraC-like DNA-binding protein